MKISINKRVKENLKKQKYMLKTKNIDNQDKKENKDIKVMKNNIKTKIAYYSIFTSMLCISIISLYTSNKIYKDINSEDYKVITPDEESISVIKSIDNLEQISISNNKDTRFNEIKKSDIDKKYITKSNNSNSQIIKEKVKKLEFIKPINGGIIKDYSKGELVYSLTLDSWRIHNGVDIKCTINNAVKSSEEGIIEKVYEDSLYGNTIIIKHENKYKTIYSNVKAKVKENKKVNKGDIIGYVDNSGIIESKNSTHIHFMMLLNDDIIDPNSKINFK